MTHIELRQPTPVLPDCLGDRRDHKKSRDGLRSAPSAGPRPVALCKLPRCCSLSPHRPVIYRPDLTPRTYYVEGPGSPRATMEANKEVSSSATRKCFP
ncbi:hypothetical protein J4Q44_G00293250 [Coregonus suidteri]|uniref:Uncharacterized protein n=1 Tax=Coregonus suidteri TaxID=861788 RepID=A0AAN8L0S0_9TELE